MMGCCCGEHSKDTELLQQVAVDKATPTAYNMCSGRSVPPLKQGLCWEVLVEALIGLCGFQVPTRWFAENKNTHI